MIKTWKRKKKKKSQYQCFAFQVPDGQMAPRRGTDQGRRAVGAKGDGGDGAVFLGQRRQRLVRFQVVQ